VADVFGPDVMRTEALEEDETNEEFLSMGAAKVGTSERGVEQYHAAALDLAERIVDNAGAYPVLAGCVPFEPKSACIADAIEHFGSRLWRRPMHEDEIARIAAVTEAATEADPVHWKLGMSRAIAALLASPNFIYVAEVGEIDPATGVRRYTGHEIASRLSYMLWNSTPDDELLRAAAAGELVTADGVRAQAARMLEAPRAADLATRFFGESWGVSGLDVTDKNTDFYPEWTPELVDAYLTEFDLFLRDLSGDRDILELFTATSSFADATLAAIYGASSDASSFEPFALPDTRAGLLTSGAVIAAVSPSDRTSPTHRGVFVLEKILCVEVPPPPANVDNVLQQPSSEEAATLRDKLEQHRADPACAGCHSLMDPLGFTFEHFDTLGRYRDVDNGVPVDATGELEDQIFNGMGDLAAFIATDPRTTACLSERLYTYAAAHAPNKSERDVVEALTEELRKHHRFKELVIALVASDAFRFMGEGGGA
jgi:hypothetical protein